MTTENINIEEIIKDAKLILFKYDVNLLYPEEQIDDIILLIIICFPKMQKSKSICF